MRTWIKDPLAIFATSAERGLVVEDGRIAETVAGGREPAAPVDAVFDASRHVVLPGLVNAHHHFFQTLTRAHPAAINRELFPWLHGALSDLGAAEAASASPRRASRLDRIDAVGLHDGRRPSLSLPAGAGKRRRHRGRGGARARPAHDGDARLDEPRPEGKAACRPIRWCRTRTRSSPTASAC